MTRRPHIAYVAHSLDPGGTEKLVVEMSKGMSERFRISVFCLDSPGEWAADLRGAGVTVNCIGRQPGFDIAASNALAREFRNTGVDLVHAHQYTPWFYSALARLRHSRPKLMFEEHGRFFPEADKPLRRWVNRHVIRHLTNRIVAVSNDIRERLVRYEGLDAADIDVVYNGVPPPQRMSNEDRTSLRAKLGFAADDFVVGSVGRFDSIKNFPMFVDGLRTAAASSAGIKGMLVGDGPEFNAIRKRAADLDKESRLVMTGYRSDVPQLVQCMDLFVLTSLSEGTSMALLEAMSCGVPAAVTDVGGNPEIVRAGVTGWIMPSGDANAFAAIVDEAANDQEKTIRFGEAGYDRYAKRFSFAGMMESYRAVYDEMLKVAS